MQADNSEGSETHPDREVLTPREQEVLTLVAQGMTYKEVGAVLYLTERTIKYHMGEIIARLHLENRAQVIEFARRTGFVEPGHEERKTRSKRDKDSGGTGYTAN